MRKESAGNTQPNGLCFFASSQDPKCAGREMQLKVLYEKYPIFLPAKREESSNTNAKFSKKNNKIIENCTIRNLISSAQHLGLFFERNELMLIAHEKHHLHELLHKSSKNGIGLITEGLSNNGKENHCFSHCLSRELRTRNEKLQTSALHAAALYLT